MEYFYHYAKGKNCDAILREGLRLGRSMRSRCPDPENIRGIEDRPAIFGLPSPAPNNWLAHDDKEANSLHPPCAPLEHLLKCISETEDELVLLKVRLQPDDQVRIADYGGVWERYDLHDMEALRQYAASTTKVQDQFNIAAKKLPEVLCFNPIPASRIELVERIPTRACEDILAYIDGKRAAPSQPRTGHPGKYRRLISRPAHRSS